MGLLWLRELAGTGTRQDGEASSGCRGSSLCWYWLMGAAKRSPRPRRPCGRVEQERSNRAEQRWCCRKAEIACSRECTAGSSRRSSTGPQTLGGAGTTRSSRQETRGGDGGETTYTVCRTVQMRVPVVGRCGATRGAVRGDTRKTLVGR